MPSAGVVLTGDAIRDELIRHGAYPVLGDHWIRLTLAAPDRPPLTGGGSSQVRCTDQAMFLLLLGPDSRPGIFLSSELRDGRGSEWQGPFRQKEGGKSFRQWEIRCPLQGPTAVKRMQTAKRRVDALCRQCLTSYSNLDRSLAPPRRGHLFLPDWDSFPQVVDGSCFYERHKLVMVFQNHEPRPERLEAALQGADELLYSDNFLELSIMVQSQPRSTTTITTWENSVHPVPPRSTPEPPR